MKMLKKYPYLKCIPCSFFYKDRIGRCIIEDFVGDKSHFKCAYGTGLSIWKWVIRLFTFSLLSIPLYILHWYFTQGLPCLINKTSESGSVIGFAVSITIALAVTTIVFIVSAIARINKTFRDKGGKYL